MKLYHSTRGMSREVTSSEAVLRGIAEDGGLYVPEMVEGFTQNDIRFMQNMDAYSLFALVISRILDICGYQDMRKIVEEGYSSKFAAKDITPLINASDMYVLELFRGPTAAFKDIALSLLPRFMSIAKEKTGMEKDIRVLTATSGDTGKAALEGFRDVNGTSITVFYPEGGVSEIQLKQMATQEGKNVRVCAVRGNFDDAQTGVKAIFNDRELGRRLSEKNLALSSANSINIGRLCPQIAYYFKAYIDLINTNAITFGDEVNFAVPTGNFGNILAGEYAKLMGLPIGKLICASNANNVLTDFINTGVYNKKRKFYKTTSPSMDILVSSNLERCLYIMSNGDSDLVSELMKSLSDKGEYRAPNSLMSNMRRDFAAYSADDLMALDAISRIYKECGYLLDPHTAVGWRAVEDYRERTGDTRKTVVLATASPYKFASDVLCALDKKRHESGFTAIDSLQEITGVSVPKNLNGLRDKPVLHSDVISVGDMKKYVECEQ